MKVFQIRQDDRFAWYETDQEQMERMVNVCGWQGRVLELAKDGIPAQTGMIGITAAELSAMINWLENGCDPKEAAKELRLYGERAWTGVQPVQQPAPPENLSDPLDLVGWLRIFAGDGGYTHNDYADVMRQAAFAIERLSVQQPVPVAVRMWNWKSAYAAYLQTEPKPWKCTYWEDLSDESKADLEKMAAFINAHNQSSIPNDELTWESRIVFAAPVAAPVADTTMSMALEMVDACMDVTQVEPEDAAAWQIVRSHFTGHGPASVDNWVFRNDGSEPDWAAHQAAEERDDVPAASVQPDDECQACKGSSVPGMVRGIRCSRCAGTTVMSPEMPGMWESGDVSGGATDCQPDSGRDAALALAYGIMWHVNAGMEAPAECKVVSVTPERAAYEARKVLREMLTHEQRGHGINAAREKLLAAHPANVAQPVSDAKPVAEVRLCREDNFYYAVVTDQSAVKPGDLLILAAAKKGR